MKTYKPILLLLLALVLTAVPGMAADKVVKVLAIGSRSRRQADDCGKHVHRRLSP